MPAELKRGRGRPRKDGQPVHSSKPKNPDYEPATKGYVKCIARKLADHTHKRPLPMLNLSVAIAGYTSGACWIFAIPETEIYKPSLITGIFLISIVCTINLIDWGLQTETKTASGDFSVIQKYQPPAECCEPAKKECEE